MLYLFYKFKKTQIRKIILDKATDLSNKATSTLTPILQKLNITDINSLPSTCPAPDVINSVVPILNNFVQDINSQVSNIDRLNQTVNSSTTALKTTKQTEWFSCLITSDHKIQIGNEVFWDWEDHFIKT